MQQGSCSHRSDRAASLRLWQTPGSSQHPPHASPKQKKHLGQPSPTSWEAVLGFPPPYIKHFASAIYLSFFKIKPSSAQFPQKSRKPHRCFNTIILYIKDAQDKIFQVPLGPRPMNFYLMSPGAFENLTSSYSRDIKPKERLIKKYNEIFCGQI